MPEHLGTVGAGDGWSEVVGSREEKQALPVHSAPRGGGELDRSSWKENAEAWRLGPRI